MRVGCEAQGGAFEAARLPAPRALELVKPDAADRMKRGSGWGNTPRPLVQLCVCEQASLTCVLRGEPGGERRGDGQRVLGLGGTGVMAKLSHDPHISCPPWCHMMWCAV
jgi:hypothetical protein